MTKDHNLVVKIGEKYEKMKALHDSQKELMTLRVNLERVMKQHAKAKEDLEKAIVKNIAVSSTAVVAALSNQLVDFAVDAVIETEKVEQRGSIHGQKLLVGYLVNDLNGLEGLRGSDMLYKKKHNIPDY
ncbi:hypothetical protein SGCOL_005511 [Colletotrichum sp. CLE4]